MLVDADLQFGDVAVMLKLAPQRTPVDAINNMDRLDSTMTSSSHPPRAVSLDVLAAPLEPSFAIASPVTRWGGLSPAAHDRRRRRRRYAPTSKKWSSS